MSRQSLRAASAVLLTAGPALAQEAGDAGGFLTLINVLWVFVGLLFLVAVGGLFGKYIFPLIVELPEAVLELGAFVLAGALAFITPHYLSSTVSFICAIVSLPFFIGATVARLGEWWRVTLVVVVGYCAAITLVHQSMFFGGVAVFFLLGLCGSWFFPFIEDFAGEGGSVFVPSGFYSAGALLMCVGGLSMTTYSPPWLGLFKPGLFWLAGSVYTGALLTLSCRYYHTDRQIGLSWLGWQVIAIGSGLACLYVGHVYAARLNTTVLQEIGGTFLAVFLIEKLCEIPWDLAHWPWIALGCAVGAYFAVNFASQHPDYFLAF